MTKTTCICGSTNLDHGNGWTSLMCKLCTDIMTEDMDYNRERLKAYNRKEITIEELRAGYRNRIKEMYYSQPKTATGGEGQTTTTI